MYKNKSSETPERREENWKSDLAATIARMFFSSALVVGVAAISFNKWEKPPQPKNYVELPGLQETQPNDYLRDAWFTNHPLIYAPGNNLRTDQVEMTR